SRAHAPALRHRSDVQDPVRDAPAHAQSPLARLRARELGLRPRGDRRMNASPARAGAVTMRSPPSWLIEAGYVGLLTLGARLIVGPGAVSYDPGWSLIWGRQIVHGHRPDYEALLAATPHPLSNAISVLLALIPLHAA